MGNPKECFKTHTMLHSISGAGVGLVVVGLFPDMVNSALWLGIVLIVSVVALEFFVKDKKIKR